MKPGGAARLRAAEVVRRVTDEGAHSNVLLGRPTDLEDRDRATAHRLALDTLRWLPRADRLLTGASHRPLETLDPDVRATLRVAVTELVTGGDPHGVVDGAVETARVTGHAPAAGFVNAVLRTISRHLAAGGNEVPSPEDLGCPPWIHERLTDAWGRTEAEAFLRATLEPAPMGIHLRRAHGGDRSGHPGWARPVDDIPGAALATDRNEVAAAGPTVMVMDPASVAVALAVDARPGASVLDMAAAPGNKTAVLWDHMDGRGSLVAADRHRRRAGSARRRLTVSSVAAHWIVADGRTPPFARGIFDRILVDAPCTGLGTLRRRPEIKLTLDPRAPARMAAVQREIVAGALPLLAPGGRLVYSVCTVFPEETTEVAAEFGGRPPPDIPGRVWGAGLLMAPHLTATDGMYITVIDGG